MPRNSSGGVGGMFDGLKSRLGLGRDEDNYDDGYDDYDDDDYDSYDDGYDDYSDYGSDYDDSAPVGGFRPVSTGSTRSTGRSSGRSSRDLSSNLVSIEDVKASTRIPDRLNRDPLASTDDSYSSRSSRNVIDRSASSASSSTYSSSYGGRSRSEGLDSLFEPSGARGDYDPYEAYSSSTPSSHTPIRTLTVIKPVVYGDVERVSRAVKSGDVVVLAMRNTPDDLSKRLLDFSFGVASALDASVECPGDKVFAISRGSALTESEKLNLRNQGVL